MNPLYLNHRLAVDSNRPQLVEGCVERSSLLSSNDFLIDCSSSIKMMIDCSRNSRIMLGSKASLFGSKHGSIDCDRNSRIMLGSKASLFGSRHGSRYGSVSSCFTRSSSSYSTRLRRSEGSNRRLFRVKRVVKKADRKVFFLTLVGAIAIGYFRRDLPGLLEGFWAGEVNSSSTESGGEP